MKAQETRAQILDAAWALIAEQGAGVRMSDIAKQVGVSRQSIYLHFGSRGGMLMALVRRADERFEIREAFDAAVARPDPAERLDAAITAWLGFVPKIAPVARDLIRLRATDADARAAWEDRMSDLRNWIRVLIQSLKRDGVLRPGWSVGQAADFFWVTSSVQAWDLLVRECGWKERAAAKRIRKTIKGALLES